jgi:hypothetical protein
MIGTIVLVAFLVVAAFGAGALVYRNNAKKAEAAVVDLEKKLNDLKAKLEGVV